MNSLAEGKISTFIIAIVQCGLMFVTHLSSGISSSIAGAVNQYTFLLSFIGLIFVGLNVLAFVDFSEKNCRIMGKISVTTILAVFILANIIDIVRFALEGYLEYFPQTLFVYPVIWGLVYGGLLAAYFVLNAKFPVKVANAPDIERAQINK